MSDDRAIDRLLRREPFELDAASKSDLFAAAMREAFAHHVSACDTFRRYCLALGYAPGLVRHDLADYPYLPVTMFKERRLSSVGEDQIVNVVRSSATTGKASRVAVDRITARRQALASAKVIAAYLGQRRRRFLFLDEPPSAGPPEMPARAAATRGFLVLASDAEYFCTGHHGPPVLDEDRLLARLGDCEASGENVCVFGFTAVVYEELIGPLLRRGRRFRLGGDSAVAHIGGWKRLAGRQVDRGRFVDDAQAALGVAPDRVFDFYGFTEQIGLVYGSAGTGPKQVPAYAEVIIRDPNTLQPAPDGSPGLIQVLTPLPHSHPGISVLTEDVGRIVGRGPDPAGRHGARFEVLGRAATAEPRGCGDLAPMRPDGG